ncbi:hypothetical protein IGI46_004755 [Enterococcus sp. AZ163]
MEGKIRKNFNLEGSDKFIFDAEIISNIFLQIKDLV